MAGSDLARRVGVAAVGIPFGVLVIYLGAWSVALVVGALAGLGAREVYRLAEARGLRPFPWLGVPAAVILVLGAAWSGGVFASWTVLGWVILLALTAGALSASLFRRGSAGGPLPAAAATVFGVVYVGGTLSFAVLLRAFPGGGGAGPGWDGAFLLVLPLVATWLGDSAAYFAGHRWGKRKLMPSVSPGKTVAGGVGGLLGATAGASAVALVLLGPGSPAVLPVAAAAVLGLLIGGVAQVGDLVASLLKREAGVKDSGGLLPGHGGVLDRFDALLFTLPLTYALLPLFLR